MKTTAIFLLFTLLLLGALSTTSAVPYIDVAQSVNFNDGGAGESYWAFIWDYTNGERESATSGFVDEYTTLDYRISWWGEVHVAYLYYVEEGRYIEALALRDVFIL